MNWNLDTLIAAAVPFFFVGIFFEIYYSKKKSLHLYRANDTITNLSLGVVQQLTAIYSKAFPIFLFQIVQTHFQFFTLPQNIFGWVVAFFLVDFVYYWFHRKAHEVNLLWASHVAHHSSEEYNLSVALRQSSIQMFFSAFFYLPLVLVGVTWEMFGICYGLNLIYQFWIHTEVVRNFGPLDLIFNSPSHHRVHHGKNPKYIDRNHAGVFIIWDRLFGTYQEEEEKPIYGITTPLTTFDPLIANLHHFSTLAKDLNRANSLSDHWNILFKKPGWRPEYMGGPQLPQEINPQEYFRFDPKISRRKLVLCMLGFIFCIGVGVYLQNRYQVLSPITLASLVIGELIFLSVIGNQLSKNN